MKKENSKKTKTHRVRIADVAAAIAEQNRIKANGSIVQAALNDAGLEKLMLPSRINKVESDFIYGVLVDALIGKGVVVIDAENKIIKVDKK